MMPVKYTYLLVDFLCIIFPFLFSFHPKIEFRKQWKYLLVPGGVTALFFLVWDILFTAHGVWCFNPNYVIGVYILGLPIEEYLFFICIPYSCIFTYYVLTRYVNFDGSKKTAQVISYLLIVFLIAVGFLNAPRLYTSITFVLLAVLISYLMWRRANYLAGFYTAYCILLIPFFISNGVLTGSFFGRVVVQYNNDYNLGLRMLTIPFEDIFYGMLLLLMTVVGYERRRLVPGEST